MRILLLILLFYQTPYADEIGIVSKVVDGDTIYLVTKNKQRIKIRLEYIDAPELDQPFGVESKLILTNLILNKEVLFDAKKKDRYQRYLTTLFHNGIDINLEMLRNGAAWHYKKYAHLDQTKKQYLDYEEAEKEAKYNKFGLWSNHAIPPWIWRQN